MGISIRPEELSHVLSLVEQLEQELVSNVAARLADQPHEMKLLARQIAEESKRLDMFKPDTKEYDEIVYHLRILEDKMMSATSEWQLWQLSQMGKLNQENLDTIAKYSGKTLDELHTMLNNVGIASLEGDEAAYEEAYKKGIISTKAPAIAMSPRIAETLAAGLRNADDVMNLINTTALESAKTAFMGAVNRAYLETVTGTKSFDAAVRSGVERMAADGITGATYKTGNKILHYSLDSAVRMNVTTSVNNTLRELQFSRMDDWGWDLIEVSSHAGARPGCAPYQGRIYSRSGKDKKYPALADTSYGRPDGLFGINCHHTFFPFLPGVNKPSFSHDPAADMGRDNDQIYREQQEQRKLERDVRKEKRKYLAGKAAGDQEIITKASVRLKEKEQQLTRFLKDTGRTRYGERQQVVGFGRSEAGNARKLNNFTRHFQDVTISLPDGTFGKLSKNAVLTDVQVFAGPGSNKELRVKEFLAQKYGGDPNKWVHAKGRSYIDVDGEQKKAVIHWFQEESAGIKEAKVKGWSKK